MNNIQVKIRLPYGKYSVSKPSAMMWLKNFDLTGSVQALPLIGRPNRPLTICNQHSNALLGNQLVVLQEKFYNRDEAKIPKEFHVKPLCTYLDMLTVITFGYGVLKSHTALVNSFVTAKRKPRYAYFVPNHLGEGVATMDTSSARWCIATLPCLTNRLSLRSAIIIPLAFLLKGYVNDIEYRTA
ncbi:hypothetical protein PR048_002776, partial [Dryococelus australis]